MFSWLGNIVVGKQRPPRKTTDTNWIILLTTRIWYLLFWKTEFLVHAIFWNFKKLIMKNKPWVFWHFYQLEMINVLDFPDAFLQQFVDCCLNFVSAFTVYWKIEHTQNFQQNTFTKIFS